MSTAHAEPLVEDVVTKVSDGLTTSGMAIIPKRMLAETYTDGLGDDAWRLILVLPRPSSREWDMESVFRLRRTATRQFDQLIEGTSLVLPGRTLAVVTTDEAEPDDVAVEEVPEKGEDPHSPDSAAG